MNRLVLTPAELAADDSERGDELLRRTGLPAFMVGQRVLAPQARRMILPPGAISCRVLDQTCDIKRVVWSDEAGDWLYRLDVLAVYRMDNGRDTQTPDYEWLVESEIEPVEER